MTGPEALRAEARLNQSYLGRLPAARIDRIRQAELEAALSAVALDPFTGSASWR